jgi:hypothetical protein
VPQSGSDKPLIRPLDGGLQPGIASLVGTGEGLIPLDPSRGGALKALIQKTNLFHIFKKGGPIMWPLLIASILALGTVIERVFFLMNEKVKRDPRPWISSSRPSGGATSRAPSRSAAPRRTESCAP